MKFKVFSLPYNFDWRLLVLHIIYFALLLWIYTTHILDIYGYVHTEFKDALNINKAIFAQFAITAAFALLRNNGLPSYLFLNIIIAFTLTPSLVIFSGSDLSFSFLAVTWIAFAILAMVARFFRLCRIRAPQINATILLRWLAGLSLLLIASIFAYGGGRFINFDLSRVGEFRYDAGGNLPRIFGYLIPSFAYAIYPLGIGLSFVCRQKLLIIVFIFCAVMGSALSSDRGTLFAPVAVIFIYWFSQHPKPSNLTLLALITVVVIGGLAFYLSQSGVGGIIGWFGSLAIYRSLFGPSLLNSTYYDFFSLNPYNYWAGHKFTLDLFVGPYDLRIPNLIGLEVWGNAEMCANTGWIGSGMGQAGYFGVALYSVLIGLLLSLFDAYAKKLGYSIVAAAFLIHVLVITTSIDFTVVFLNHGLLMLLLIVILLKPNLKHYKNSATMDNVR